MGSVRAHAKRVAVGVSYHRPGPKAEGIVAEPHSRHPHPHPEYPLPPLGGGTRHFDLRYYREAEHARVAIDRTVQAGTGAGLDPTLH